ncbi:hypothetical protein C8P66_103158 [Humitalea rosea]|uniref:Uncharacterized protein n=1 Tax=Humitalea rosea TaxID=990373 RepID=A0A2W7IPG2_9PROT|nr:hypothetical protein [Humitalea rosea]PZW49132.1 hypothetical protein C8P66_103158 [Humitalea rosea]
MSSPLPTLFADGVVEANVTHGVARITLGQAGADGKPQPCGVLIVPLVQLPVVANGLLALLKQIDTKMKEAQAAAGPAAAPAAAEPAVPSDGAFRFNA